MKIESRKLKTYLNKKERNDLVVFAAVIGYLEKNFVAWYDHNNMSKIERKYTKMALTLMDKVINSILKRLDQGFGLKIINDIKDSKLFCIPKREAQIQMNAYAKTYGDTYVKTDSLAILAEKALEHCNPCTVKNYKECILHDIFSEMGIEAFDFEAVNKCEYKITGDDANEHSENE